MAKKPTPMPKMAATAAKPKKAPKATTKRALRPAAPEASSIPPTRAVVLRQSDALAALPRKAQRAPQPRKRAPTSTYSVTIEEEPYQRDEHSIGEAGAVARYRGHKAQEGEGWEMSCARCGAAGLVGENGLSGTLFEGECSP